MTCAVRSLLRALAAIAALAAPALAQPDLALTGTLTGADHETYREIPFHVPPGVRQLTVEFDYTGKEQRAVIDLGLRDPQRFRGWSGGNKRSFTLAETFATPSYLPGPLPAGEWRLILGVPNMRKDARADYRAEITFRRDDRFQGFAAGPLKAAPGWFRGDLHLHTGHSDGYCASREGRPAPCPLVKTLEAAAARGLDFVAVTEHNATSHHQALAELQPHFDDLLLIPGREITTFEGHLGVIGMVEPLEFQLGGPRASGFADLLARAAAAGALSIVNHPGLPSGESCMGCGWRARTDFAAIGAVEVLNGATLAQAGGADAVFSGVPFWEARLNEGRRITAVGGSDNHDAPRPLEARGAVGSPTTVVYAEALSQPAILAGLASGRVFIDVEGTSARVLDISLRAGERAVPMGRGLSAAAGESLVLEVSVEGAEGGRLVFSGPAAAGLADPAPLSADERRSYRLTSPGSGWLRVDVRGPGDRLWLLGNPIHLIP